MTRPQVPDWIRTFAPPTGWTNVFGLVPSNDHLYGTETLFGDWGGETLLLAKDGAPTPVIRALRDRGDPRPWRHAQRELRDPGGWKTNESLSAAAAVLPGGKLYGSATANLLYDDPRWSRSLPGFYTPGPLQEYLKEVLLWVLDSMPNIERVVCLGQEAWFLTHQALGVTDVARRFASHRDSFQTSGGCIREKRITTVALFHPAARVSDASKRAGWLGMLSRPLLGDFGVDERRQPELIGTTMRHVVSPRAADDDQDAPAITWEPKSWTNWIGKRAQSVGNPTGTIHPHMIAILDRAGATGVGWTDFQALAWRPGFDAKRVDKAIGQLAVCYGYPLQFRGDRGRGRYPDQYRVAPKWVHKVGKRTSDEDFGEDAGR